MKNKILFAGLMLATCLGALVVLPTPVSAALIPSVTVQIPEPVPGKKPSYAAVIEPSSKVQNLSSDWLRCSSTSIYTCTIGVMAASATFVEGEYYAYEIRLQRIEVPDYFLDTKFTINGLVPDSINVHNIAEATIRSKVYQAKHTYGYTLTPSGNYTFPAKTVGYGAPGGYEFTVQSTSSTTITVRANISGSGASAFNITIALPYPPTSDISLGTGGGLVKYTITPKTGLTAGTYNATITVSGEKVASRSFDVGFTVNSAAGTTSPDSSTGSTVSGDNGRVDGGGDVGDSVDVDDVEDSSTEGGDMMVGGVALDEKTDEGEDEGFNWLWVLFGVLATTAVGGGVWLLLAKKRGVARP